MSETASSAPTPHPDFCYSVYPVTFQAEDKTFTIDASRLLRISEGFATILDGHFKSSIPNEGSAAIPIVLPDTTASSFANFLKWLYLDPLTTVQMTQTQLIDILAISHRWVIPLGIDYAVAKLAELPLSPAFQFHLLRRYDIEVWIPRVTRALLLTDLDDLTAPDATFLGISIFYTIQRYREKIIFHRMRLGRRIPYPDDRSNAPFCPNHSQCYKDWHETWITHVQIRILGSPRAFPLSQCAQFVDSLSHTRMAADCKEHLVSWLSTLPVVLREEELVLEAVDAVQALL
ncbi:hypothetical protein CVT26_001062 [Gymnopilus dilepis]|uniref:BTB domain-containing protein n=1 Tax=Gymnopilus dilepis TaxID=231916 RepID=A0A409WL89_9AGAR|nr:hypothetical protein CVT26_001062 [Gymnopilus dilepis]